MVWILIVAGLSFLVASIHEIHRVWKRKALEARLEAILAPQSLSQKYLCLMSDEERREFETGRWD